MAKELALQKCLLEGQWLLNTARTLVVKGKSSTILTKYIDFIEYHSRPEMATIVFDGSSDDKAKITKLSSAKKEVIADEVSAATVVFAEAMTSTMPKDEFLSN